MIGPSDQRTEASPFLQVFEGKALVPPPIWLMRQAGRYLPEYREVRSKVSGFLDLCYTPPLACEVTLQPIRRYGFDAAILFADILVVPDALGQKVEFVEGEGPRLEPVRSAEALARLDTRCTETKFSLIYETVARLRDRLPTETALIGFCGAPWTVATYVVGGQGSSDQAEARLLAYREPELFGRLIDLLVESSVQYLSGQILAGADAVQIFDSWAGNLPPGELSRWVIEPTARMVTKLRARHATVPIIGFPRGAGVHVPEYVDRTGVNGIGCDSTMPMADLRERVADLGVVLQGNLDPLLLVVGGQRMETRVREILSETASFPFIFNLGHGIVPETPPEHVGRLVELVRGGVR
jgi:uroporphyrinogen decarboxylase